MDPLPNGTKRAAERKLKLGCVVDLACVLRRIDLERRLRASVSRLLLLLVCLVCFTVSLYELHPTEEVGRVHESLRVHLGLTVGAPSLVNLGEVYAFAEAFEGLSGVLRATAPLYWCERRYLTVAWNATMRAPSRLCASPRHSALGHAGGAVPWSNKSVTENATRLANCVDDSEGLRNLTRGLIDSCSVADGEKLCGSLSTAVFCKRTCGYCAPFDYDAAGAYRDPSSLGTLTLLPSVVFQTRWRSRRCNDLGSAYNHLMARTFSADEEVVLCADRLASLDEGANASGSGAGGKAQTFGGWPFDFWKRAFGERSVYPVLLAQPAADLQKLRNLQWLDGLTESVTVATLTYAKEAEVFTYLAVEFKVNEAGDLIPQVEMESYKEIRLDTRADSRLLAWLCCTVIFGSLGLAWSLVSAARCKRKRTAGQALEALTYLLLVALAITVICLREENTPNLVDKYNRLLTAWIEDGSSDAGHEAVLTSFFETARELRAAAWFMTSHRIAGWAILHLMVFQAFRYATTHPLVASIATTFTKGFDSLCHASFVFLVFFFLLAALAHWTFAPHLGGYGTFSGALSFQLRWAVGQVKEAGLEGMSSPRIGLYWIYVVAFLFGLLWFCLYTILALILFIVNAAKEDAEDNDSELYIANNLPWDIADSFWTPLAACLRGSPSPGRLYSSLKAASAVQAPPPGAVAGRGVEVKRVYPLGVGQAVLCVSSGSIVDFNGDAIINAANETCLGGSGVDGAVTKAGGTALAMARKALPIVKGDFTRCPTGEAVITIGGDLKAARCIHAVGPDYGAEVGKGRTPEECDDLLLGAYLDSMDRAKEVGARTLAFSLLSAGIFRGPRSLGSVLTAGVEGVRANAYPGLREVHMVCHKVEELSELLLVCDVILGHGEDPGSPMVVHEHPTPEELRDRLVDANLRSLSSSSKVVRFEDDSELEDMLITYDEKCRGWALLPPPGLCGPTSPSSASSGPRPSGKPSRRLSRGASLLTSTASLEGSAGAGGGLLGATATAAATPLRDAAAGQAVPLSAFEQQMRESLDFKDVPGMTKEAQKELRARVTRQVMERLAMQPTGGKTDWDEVASTMACDIVETIVQVIYEMYSEAARTPSTSAGDEDGALRPPGEVPNDEGAFPRDCDLETDASEEV